MKETYSVCNYSLNPFSTFQLFPEAAKNIPTGEAASLQCSSARPSSRSSFRKFLAESMLLERSLSIASISQNTIERRAAIDVGSGSTKVCIADVDLATNQIVRVLYEGSFPVPYQTYLASDPDGLFNLEIQEKGLSAFATIQKLLEEHQVADVAAVATEAFRKSRNGENFARIVAEKTGIPLKVISQKDEGAIAFYSAISVSGSDPENLLIWDIGTGSFQIIADRPGETEHELVVYMQSMGSVPFKNYIIQHIQGKDPALVQSPNPMTEQDWKDADALARKMGRDALPYIKEKVKIVEGIVVGIGRLFGNSVKPIGRDGKITREDLRAFIRESLNKTDDELGDPFANVNVSNAILVLGVMKALHIHEIDIVETTSTKGLICYKPYWTHPAIA